MSSPTVATGCLQISNTGERQTADERDRPLPDTHTMSRGVTRITDLWREWKEGLGNGPAIERLEVERGVSWCQGNERRFFNRRKCIVNKIVERAEAMEGGGTEGNMIAAAEYFEDVRKRMGKSIDWVSKNISCLESL